MCMHRSLFAVQAYRLAALCCTSIVLKMCASPRWHARVAAALFFAMCIYISRSLLGGQHTRARCVGVLHVRTCFVTPAELNTTHIQVMLLLLLPAVGPCGREGVPFKRRSVKG